MKITGGITVNGVEIKEDISKMSAYIQQNDVFVGALTVKDKGSKFIISPYELGLYISTALYRVGHYQTFLFRVTIFEQ